MKKYLLILSLLALTASARGDVLSVDSLDDAMMNKAAVNTNYGTATYMRVMPVHNDSGRHNWFGDSLINDTLSALGATTVDSAKYVFVSDGVYYIDAGESLYVYLTGVVGSQYPIESQITWNIWKTGSSWTTPGGDTTGCISDTLIYTSNISADFTDTLRIRRTGTAKGAAWLDSLLTSTGNTGAIIVSTYGGTTNYQAYIDIWSEDNATSTNQPKLLLYYSTAGTVIKKPGNAHLRNSKW